MYWPVRGKLKHLQPKPFLVSVWCVHYLVPPPLTYLDFSFKNQTETSPVIRKHICNSQIRASCDWWINKTLWHYRTYNPRELGAVLFWHSTKLFVSDDWLVATPFIAKCGSAMDTQGWGFDSTLEGLVGFLWLIPLWWIKKTYCSILRLPEVGPPCVSKTSVLPCWPICEKWTNICKWEVGVSVWTVKQTTVEPCYNVVYGVHCKWPRYSWSTLYQNISKIGFWHGEMVQVTGKYKTWIHWHDKHQSCNNKLDNI